MWATLVKAVLDLDIFRLHEDNGKNVLSEKCDQNHKFRHALTKMRLKNKMLLSNYLKLFLFEKAHT